MARRWLMVVLGCGLQVSTCWAVLVADRPQVTIRSDATVHSDKVEVVVQGEELEKVRRKGDWFQVRLPDGRNGWVHYTLVVERESAPAKAAKTAKSARPKAEAPAPAPSPRPPAAKETRSPEAPPAEQTPAEDLKRNPYAEGLQHEVEGDYAAALRSFEEALQQDPENLNALIHAAGAHEQMGEMPAALQQLYRALEKSPGNRAVYSRLAEVYQQRSEADSAGKYQALARGETPAAPPPEKTTISEPEPPQPVEDVLWVYLAGVAGICVLGLGTMWWWHRRSRAADEEEEGDELPPARAERWAPSCRQSCGPDRKSVV